MVSGLRSGPPLLTYCGRSGDNLRLRAPRRPGQQMNSEDAIKAYKDVLDAGGCHHFGLLELRTGDADCAGGDFHMSDGGFLLPFCVRTPVDPRLPERRRHSIDGALHPVKVDQQNRCVKLVFICTYEPGTQGIQTRSLTGYTGTDRPPPYQAAWTQAPHHPRREPW